MAIKTDWNDGEVLYADDLNDTFDETIKLSEFGDGSDGELNLTSGTTNLSGNRVYNYTSVNIDAGATLSTTDQNKPIIILSQEDVTIEGTINLNGKGGNGGSAPAGESETQAINGWGIIDKICYGHTATGSASSKGGAEDGGGAGMKNEGTDGRNHPDSKGEIFHLKVNYIDKSQIALGSGGGAGESGRWGYTNRGGGSGGNGGGGIIIIARGEIIVSGSITCNGNNGSVGTAGDGGGGSGGCIILYALKGITNTGTITANGGTGAGNAGTGSVGYVCLLSKTDWANGI
jgi:hypothetical protein